MFAGLASTEGVKTRHQHPLDLGITERRGGESLGGRVRKEVIRGCVGGYMKGGLVVLLVALIIDLGKELSISYRQLP